MPPPLPICARQGEGSLHELPGRREGGRKGSLGEMVKPSAEGPVSGDLVGSREGEGQRGRDEEQPGQGG